MKKRTVTGVFITLAVYLIVAFSHIPAVLYSATGLLCIFAVYEIYHAAGLFHDHRLLLISVAAAAGITVCPFQHYGAICGVLLPVSVFLFGWMMARQKNIAIDRPWKTMILALLVVLQYRAIPELRGLSNGLAYLFGAITLCFVTDVAAYFIGSRFGKYKLIPSVSPNKTVEGSLAGIAGAVLLMVLLGFLLGSVWGIGTDYVLLTVYAVLASIVGQFGDLAMSIVKRICGIKDFSDLFPGHGGMLDRFDSHLFCIPFTLLFVLATGGFFH